MRLVVLILILTAICILTITCSTAIFLYLVDDTKIGQAIRDYIVARTPKGNKDE